MHLQQVCMTAMAFSAARGGAIEMTQGFSMRPVVIRPLRGGNETEIYVEQDNQAAGSWYVGLRETKPLALRPPVYFPAVNTQEALLDALTKAWEFHRETRPPEPFLTRFVEPPQFL